LNIIFPKMGALGGRLCQEPATSAGYGDGGDLTDFPQPAWSP